MKLLKDLFLDELADMLDAERRIAKALPKLAKSATCQELKKLLQEDLGETEGHAGKIGEVFAAFGATPKRKTCLATVGLLSEADEVAAEFKGSPAINAALISASQRIQHYEIASYGCLHEWAGLLGNPAGATILKDLLAEEKAANDALVRLARAHSNRDALGEVAAKAPPAPETAPPAAPKAVRPGTKRALATV